MHVPTAPFGFKHKPVPSVANILFCISCQQCVILTHQPNTTVIIYWLSIQHRATFLLSTSPSGLSQQTQHYRHNILTVSSTPLHISAVHITLSIQHHSTFLLFTSHCLFNTAPHFCCPHHTAVCPNKHNTSDIIYWLSIQHCSTFLLSTSHCLFNTAPHFCCAHHTVYSTPLHISAVHFTQRSVSTNSDVKFLYNNDNNYCEKECIRKLSGTIQCIWSNAKLECKIKQKKKQGKIKQSAGHVLQCSIGHSK